MNPNLTPMFNDFCKIFSFASLLMKAKSFFIYAVDNQDDEFYPSIISFTIFFAALYRGLVFAFDLFYVSGLLLLFRLRPLMLCGNAPVALIFQINCESNKCSSVVVMKERVLLPLFTVDKKFQLLVFQ
ncbi:hypothetical protein P8452_36919 [Trifolium repens]|nr:hypothetical protein P8452_36919 [Trifolium repens]